MIHDYLTLIKTPHVCNKIVTRTPDGDIRKTAKATISEGEAMVLGVPDLSMMINVLKWASENPNRVLMQGFFPGVEPEEKFTIRSQASMRNSLGVSDDADVSGWHTIDGKRTICRLKQNVLPSSWQQLDRDIVKGMPEPLADLTEDQWLKLMAQLIPGFDAAGLIRVASTSGRVIVDGSPLAAAGSRYWFRIDDPYDLERFGAACLLNSFSAGAGFMRPVYSRSEPDKVIATRHWTIFDPTTFSPERLVFDGMPTVRGEGLEVGPASIELVRPGGVVESSLVKTPDPKEALQQAGLNLSFVPTNRKVRRVTGEVEKMELPMPLLTENKSLRLDTVIDLGTSKTTIRDYWFSDAGKLRCQTPFRDSISMNGILARRADGTPFCFDNGTRIRYDLHPDDAYEYGVVVVIKKLGELNRAGILRTWRDEVRHLPATERTKVKEWVNENTGAKLRDLGKALTAAERAWDKEAKDSSKRKRKQYTAPHKLTVPWVPHDLHNIVAKVESALFQVGGGDQVMSFAGALTRPVVEPPITVRQIMRKHELREAYPPVLLLKEYQPESLRLRLLQTCVFQLSNGDLIAPPTVLLKTMIEDSPHRAPECSGLLTHPCVQPDGLLLAARGLDPKSGLYIDIPPALKVGVPAEITQTAAHDSLTWMREVLLADWDFASDLDRDAAVSMFLTAVQRKMINDDSGSLGFCVSAPIQASGKTVLAQLLSYIVHDRPLAAQSWTTDQEEMRKSLLALLLESHPVILFDNVQEGSTISGNEMAKAMSSPKYGARILGASRNATAPTLVLWLWTGNNIGLSDDFCSRVIPIYLDPKMERPDQRSYSRDSMMEWADEHRSEFFQHALTIIAGGIRAQQTGWIPSVNSGTRFRGFNQQVLWPLIWAGGLDVSEIIANNMANDDKSNERAEVIELLHEIYPNREFTVKELFADMDALIEQSKQSWGNHQENYDQDEETKLDMQEEKLAKAEARQRKENLKELHEVLEGMMFKRLNKRSVGRLFGRFANRRYSGKWLDKITYKDSKTPAKWRVHVAKPDGAPGNGQARSKYSITI